MSSTGTVRLGGMAGLFGGGLVVVWSVLWAILGDAAIGGPPGYEVVNALLYTALMVLLNLALLLFSVALLGLRGRLREAAGNPAVPGVAGRLGTALALVTAAAAAVNIVYSLSVPGTLAFPATITVPVVLLGLPVSALLFGVTTLRSGVLGRWRWLPLALAAFSLLLFVFVPAFQIGSLLPGILAGGGWAVLGYLLLARLERTGRRAAPLR
jgi:hypothetical protein